MRSRFGLVIALAFLCWGPIFFENNKESYIKHNKTAKDTENMIKIGNDSIPIVSLEELDSVTDLLNY